jgi:hypothetical protein
LRKALSEVNLNGFMEIIAKLSARLAARAKLNFRELAKPFLALSKIFVTIVAV